MRCIAVCIEDWTPSDELFNRLIGLLDEQGAQRIQAFRFRHDALANLVGRLLPLWDTCSRNSSQAWQSIAQAREVKGRPYLIDKTNKKSLDFDFNISHDGEAIVMASERSPGTVKLGIDVMRVALPAGIPSIPEFEETVEDMLSKEEKKRLMLAPTTQKLGLLLQFWTVKEAISKAMGEGLAFPYAELDSTTMEGTGLCLVQGKECFVEEQVITLGNSKYMVAIAALGLAGKGALVGLAGKGALATEIEVISVDIFVAQVLCSAEEK